MRSGLEAKQQDPATHAAEDQRRAPAEQGEQSGPGAVERRERRERPAAQQPQGARPAREAAAAPCCPRWRCGDGGVGSVFSLCKTAPTQVAARCPGLQQGRSNVAQPCPPCCRSLCDHHLPAHQIVTQREAYNDSLITLHSSVMQQVPRMDEGLRCKHGMIFQCVVCKCSDGGEGV